MNTSISPLHIADSIFSIIHQEFDGVFRPSGLGRIIIATKGHKLSVVMDTSDEETDYDQFFEGIYPYIENASNHSIVEVKPPDHMGSKMFCYCLKASSYRLIVVIEGKHNRGDDAERSAEKILKKSLCNILHTSLKDASFSAQRRNLTPRQIECLEWVSRGKSDWEIAQLIQLSPHTVHRHIEAAKKRLNVATRVQAVLSAGLSNPD